MRYRISSFWSYDWYRRSCQLWDYHTINIPRSHPSTGECLPPPLGGICCHPVDVLQYKFWNVRQCYSALPGRQWPGLFYRYRLELPFSFSLQLIEACVIISDLYQMCPGNFSCQHGIVTGHTGLRIHCAIVQVLSPARIWTAPSRFVTNRFWDVFQLNGLLPFENFRFRLICSRFLGWISITSPSAYHWYLEILYRTNVVARAVFSRSKQPPGTFCEE